MTRYLIFIATIMSALHAQAQTKINKFCIVDAATKKPIPYASVSLARANLAMNTEEDGILTIPGNLAAFRDTIFITAQNYTSLKTGLNRLNGLDTIHLPKATAAPIDIKPSAIGRDSVINKFDWHDVSYYAGVHTENGRFNYLQMAQEFNVSASGATLTGLFICRLAHTLRWPDDMSPRQYKWIDLEITRFRLRFYDVDPKTGGPGREIHDKIVEVKNKSDQNLTIDLKEHTIVIPGKKFFVAIEWLRTFDNSGYALERSEQNLIYKPTLGILPYRTNKNNIWALNCARQWKPYTYYSPDWTDLAMSATVTW